MCSGYKGIYTYSVSESERERQTEHLIPVFSVACLLDFLLVYYSEVPPIKFDFYD